MTHPLFPQNSTYTQADWAILARYWHPVALSEEVTDTAPFGVVLLDAPLVLYRGEGALTAAIDRCPHRGTRLSLGRVRDGRLVCPYHGLEFDRSGHCARVPAHGERKAPERYLDIPTVLAQERHGLVWVCLDAEPAAPPPDWSVMDSPGKQRIIMHDVWNASAGRHFENFCDLAHFSFAHAGTFGVTDRPEVAAFDVEPTDAGFRYAVDVPMLDSDVFGSGSWRLIHSEYEITLPFCIKLTIGYSKGVEHIFDVASPISAHRSRIFILKCRDQDLDPSTAEWWRFQEAVNEEDRLMVESQSPPGVPLDISAERHLGSDRFSVIYRRRWAAMGLRGPL
jgi:vanillate O-demethylase monooxygenase subunit